MRTSIVHIALLVIVALGVYAGTLHNAFFLDDHYYILENAHIRELQPISRHFSDPTTMSSIRSNVMYRPLLPLSLSLNHALHDYDVVGYHVFNIAFHLLTVLFAYLLFAELLLIRARPPTVPQIEPPREIALVGAGIFAIHPISGFVVNYLSSRDSLMMLAFLLLALFLYTRMRRTRGTPFTWIPVVASLVFSLLAKPNAVLAPVVVVAIEVLVIGESLRAPRLWARVAPFAVLVGSFLLLRHQMLADLDQPAWGATGDADLGARSTYLLTQLDSHLFHYLRNFAWPFAVRALPSSEDGVPSDPRVWLGGAAILVSLIAAWVLRRRSPLVSFGILTYWLMFSLTSSVLPTHGIVADRWMYPSMPFISLVVVGLAYRQLPLRGARLMGALLVIYFGASSIYMNHHYRDDCAVWSQSVRYGTTSMGYVNMGRCLMSRRDDSAKLYFEKALELVPEAYIAEINLGVWYLDHDQPQQALALTRSAVAHAPEVNRGLAHHWLAKALVRTDRPQEAFEEARTAALLNPSNVQYLYGAAFQAQVIGQWDACLHFTEQIHATQRNHELSRFVAGWCNQSLGRLDQAIAEYERAIDHNPRYSRTYLNLGHTHKDRGDCEGAIRALERYLSTLR